LHEGEEPGADGRQGRDRDGRGHGNRPCDRAAPGRRRRAHALRRHRRGGRRSDRRGDLDGGWRRRGSALRCGERRRHGAAGREGRRLGGGSIVNIASVNGFWVEPALAAYCAAKGGVINLTRAIALENGRYQIRCNCICPGYIDTGMAERYFEIQDDPDEARLAAGKMHALGRVGKPEEVAAMALFLCSDEASFCTAQPFVVDGGLSAGVAAGADFAS
jgi:NAD(P)-dependent dehydrogenase (short-subunit alcohol dehydrogenase family)